MTSFHDERFPVSISSGAQGGPEFSTEVVTAGSGDEQRNRRWAAPRWKFDVATGIKNQTDANSFFAFILAVGVGQAYSFPFKDWTDFSVTAQAIGTGDGATLAFQLVKTYTVGSYTFSRRIKLPVTGTVAIYLDGALQGSGYSESARGETGGLITFVSAPGGGVVITADFEFDVPVRFGADLVQGTAITPTILLQFETISLMEVRRLT